MSVTFAKDSEGYSVIHIKGIFTFDDLKEVQSKARAEIDRGGIRLLVLAEEFSGWGKEGDWGDLTFMYEHDPHIDKIAIVANEKWKDEILIFVGAGRRQAAVESFGGEEDARNWLRSGSE